MSLDTLLSGLDKVRGAGHGKYVACCPAHDDRSPSLAIKECGDGRILLHCFAGCDIETICDALGLRLADLMSDSPIDHHVGQVRRTMPARDALQSLDHESLVVATIANDIHRHHTIDEATWDRLAQAVMRIGIARDACIPARHRP
jgi:hypothetical protein